MSTGLVNEHDEPSESLKVARLETIISYVLRFGVFLSLAITFVGLILLFVIDPSNAVVRQSGPPVPHNFSTVLSDLAQLQPKAIIDVGLLFLVATPVVRVAVTVVAFVVEGDLVFTLITLFVLLVLLASFVLGRAG